MSGNLASARNNLQRTLRPRRVFREIFRQSVFLGSLGVAVPVFLFLWGSQYDLEITIDEMILYISPWILVLIFSLTWLRSVLSYEIDIQPDGFIIRSSKGESAYSYSRVKSVNTASSPLQLLEVHMVDGTVVPISTAIERAEYVVDAIVSQRPGLLPEELFQKLRKKSVLQDHAMARHAEFSKLDFLVFYLYPTTGVILSVFIKYFFGGGSLSAVNSTNFSVVVGSLLAIVLLGLFVAFLRDRELAKLTEKNLSQEPPIFRRDAVVEGRIRDRFDIYFFVYLVSVILLFNFWLHKL